MNHQGIPGIVEPPLRGRGQQLQQTGLNRGQQQTQIQSLQQQHNLQPQQSPQHRRGRRPESEVRGDVLDAAGQILLAHGLTGFTFEKISSLSGVSRVTINRYWPSRGALALDSYLHQARGRIEFADTGDLAEDLCSTLMQWSGHLSNAEQRRVFTQLIGAAQTDEDLAAAFRSHYFGPRRIEAINMLKAGAARGQLRSDVSLEVVVDMIWGACYHRLLLPNLSGTISPQFIDELVSVTLRGASPQRAETTPQTAQQS